MGYIAGRVFFKCDNTDLKQMMCVYKMMMNKSSMKNPLVNKLSETIKNGHILK